MRRYLRIYVRVLHGGGRYFIFIRLGMTSMVTLMTVNRCGQHCSSISPHSVHPVNLVPTSVYLGCGSPPRVRASPGYVRASQCCSMRHTGWSNSRSEFSHRSTTIIIIVFVTILLSERCVRCCET